MWAVDPGDMRTDLYAAAAPWDDDSGRPEPATVVPGFLRLLDERPASGRYSAPSLADAPLVDASFADASPAGRSLVEEAR